MSNVQTSNPVTSNAELEQLGLTTKSVETPIILMVGVFTGALKAFQKTAFITLVAAGINKHVAHKVCVDYASDLGRLMASDNDLSAKIGKAKSSGLSKLTLKGGGYLTTTRSMSIVRIIQVVDELMEEKLLAGRDLPPLNETLTEYLEKCEEWAANQNWQENVISK